MLSAGGSRIMGVVAVALVCVLIVLISPSSSGPPTHLRAKRAASLLMSGLATYCGTTVSVRPITIAYPAIVESGRFISAPPVLPLICVYIC